MSKSSLSIDSKGQRVGFPYSTLFSLTGQRVDRVAYEGVLVWGKSSNPFIIRSIGFIEHDTTVEKLRNVYFDR